MSLIARTWRGRRPSACSRRPAERPVGRAARTPSPACRTALRRAQRCPLAVPGDTQLASAAFARRGQRLGEVGHYTAASHRGELVRPRQQEVGDQHREPIPPLHLAASVAAMAVRLLLGAVHRQPGEQTEVHRRCERVGQRMSAAADVRGKEQQHRRPQHRCRQVLVSSGQSYEHWPVVPYAVGEQFGHSRQVGSVHVTAHAFHPARPSANRVRVRTRLPARPRQVSALQHLAGGCVLSSWRTSRQRSRTPAASDPVSYGPTSRAPTVRNGSHRTRRCRRYGREI